MPLYSIIEISVLQFEELCELETTTMSISMTFQMNLKKNSVNVCIRYEHLDKEALTADCETFDVISIQCIQKH